MRFSPSYILLVVVCASALNDQGAGTRSTRANRSDSKRQLELELDGLHSEAAKCGPQMRAFVLWQLGQIYAAKVDPGKGKALIREAFNATLAPDMSRQDAADIQAAIVQSIGEVEENSLVSFLRSSEPAARPAIALFGVEQAIARKDFALAERIITVAGDLGDFPYSSAEALMSAYPEDATDQRRSLFFQAISAFQKQEETREKAATDLETIVVRFWAQLPRDLVVTAIDLILEDAQKGRAQGTEGAWRNDRQRASRSEMEAHIHKLMPVIAKIDENRAKALMEQYPSTAPSQGVPQSEVDAPATMSDYVQKQHVKAAKSDPPAALSQASALPIADPNVPDNSPRADAFAAIAYIAAKHDPPTARTALKELRQLRDRISPFAYVHLVSQVSGTYLILGDPAEATRTVNEALPIVKKLYATDIDRDDPNHAPKAYWPSTFMWTELAASAAKADPDLIPSILRSIPDQEIEALVKVRDVARREKVPLTGFILESRHNSATLPPSR